MRKRDARDESKTVNRRERGSTLMAAVFVLALLGAMGLILLFASQTEVKMSDADLRSKQAFYMAEAATEVGRDQLRTILEAAMSGAINPQLDIAAGANDAIDFNVDAARPQFDNDGNLTGFAGNGDDVPLVPPTAFGEGWYAAYLTNDPADGVNNPVDTNDTVMLTGLGVGPTGSFEMAQVIVLPGLIFPDIPATVLLLGPSPNFNHGSGKKGGKGWAGKECPKQPGSTYMGQKIKGSRISIDGVLYKGSQIYKAYNGTDCAEYSVIDGVVQPVKKGSKKKGSKKKGSKKKGKKKGSVKAPKAGSKIYVKLEPRGGTGGIPGLFVPNFGVVGPAAEKLVEKEVGGKTKADFMSDTPHRTPMVPRPPDTSMGYWDDDTVADLTDATEPTVIGSGFGTINPTWTDCNELKQVMEKVRENADYVCSPPGCSLPAMTPSSTAFIDGDFRVDCAYEGVGMLAVTGSLDFPASASWHGIVFVVGEGRFYRIGKDGYGNIVGATVVADIAGPDNSYGTADDCTGGVNGFDSVVFQENIKAKGTTNYCSVNIDEADPGFKEPTRTQSFRQR